MKYYILKISNAESNVGCGCREIVLKDKKKLAKLVRKISLSDNYDIAGVHVIENGWIEEDLLEHLKVDNDLVLG